MYQQASYQNTPAVVASSLPTLIAAFSQVVSRIGRPRTTVALFPIEIGSQSLELIYA